MNLILRLGVAILGYIQYIYEYIYSLRVHEEDTNENHNHVVSLYVTQTHVTVYVKKRLKFFSASKTKISK